MSKSVIKFWDKIVVVLLGTLGVFTSCNKVASDCDCVYYPPIERDSFSIAYGVLQADYEIRGMVVNQANLQPIPNIQIIREINDNYTGVSHTNADGKYIFLFDNYYQESQKNVIQLKVEDIDGKDNGGDFKTKKVKIKFAEDDKEKMDKCNRDGGMFVKIQNIVLS